MIETKSLISVIVPIYKVEKYLDRCVQSIIDQTYGNIEIILVDDGSPDGCPNMCDEWKERDDRIIVIHKANGGLSDARNKGIEASKGEFIMFVDGDDYISVNMVEKLYFSLKAYKADMSVCSFLYVDESGKAIPDLNLCNPIKDEVLSNFQAIKKLSTRQCWYYTVAWNKLYKKSLFFEIQFPYGKRNEDEFVSHALYGASNRISFISDFLYFYVQRTNSIMGQAQREINIHDLDIIEARLDRSDYVACLNMKTDAGYWYFDALMKYILFKNNYLPKTLAEKEKINYVKKLIKKNKHFFKYCNFRRRLQIVFAYFFPRIYKKAISCIVN